MDKHMKSTHDSDMRMMLTFINPTKKTLQKVIASLLLLLVLTYLFVLLLNRHYDEAQGIEEILHRERIEIEHEMEGYPYEVIAGRNVGKLSDLVMERGGNPLRSVIVSTWRSGSTFLGDLLNAHPVSYYFYEPLYTFGEFRTPLTSRKPLTVLESLFNCDFSNLGDLLRTRKPDTWHIDFLNKYVVRMCLENENNCYDTGLSTRFCRLFPLQVMKILRLDLSSWNFFLEDKNLGIKIVFLVRDPRGVMQSRKDLYWCKPDPNCNNSTILCTNMVSDYLAAVDFSKRYPEKFKVLRYEDLTSDVWKISKQIYSFYGINFHENVKKFINDHAFTNVSSDGNPYSTYRNSKAVGSQWKERMSFDEVNEIQETCHEAMKIWGYNLAMNSDHQRTFEPVVPLANANINYFK